MDVLIAPTECQRLQRVTLAEPKNGEAQHYFYDEDNLTLYEVVRYYQKYRAWFIDNLLGREGHFNMLTKIDPLFIFLPIVMKFARNQFRPLHDICQEFASSSRESSNKAKSQEHGEFSPVDRVLSPCINWASICDTQDIDGDLFVKFSEKNTIHWLVKKHDRLMECLKEELGEKASKATLISHANDLLCDYIPVELCNTFKLAVRDKHLMGPTK